MSLRFFAILCPSLVWPCPAYSLLSLAALSDQSCPIFRPANLSILQEIPLWSPAARPGNRERSSRTLRRRQRRGLSG